MADAALTENHPRQNDDPQDTNGPVDLRKRTSNCPQ